MATPTAPTPHRPPDEAYEITITIRNGAGSTRLISHTRPRRVVARALPSLPVTGPDVPAFWPPYRLEVFDATGALLYRRPYARPGYAEAYGLDSAWTRLPRFHEQWLVTLIPIFGDARGLLVKAFEPTSTNTPWLTISLP